MATGPEIGDKQGDGRERRRFNRKEVFTSQLVTVELGEGRAAILIDVSEDGIAVQPIRPLKLGTRVKVDFALPSDAGFVQGQGEVVWVGRTGRAGVRFSHLTQRSWCDLDRWLRVVEDPLAEAIKNFSQRHEAASDETGSQETKRFDLQTVLELITERACTVTNAEGAAFVVESVGEFVCCSTVGSAPEIGVMVKPQSLTGESLRHGVSVICGDIAMDVRANLDGEGYASSVLVVPILTESQIVGGIVALSGRKDAFAERDVARLKRLAEIAAKLADELRTETTALSADVSVETNEEDSFS
jgi:putative methionine-R-sulfoxide reductase with GAF domain